MRAEEASAEGSGTWELGSFGRRQRNMGAGKLRRKAVEYKDCEIWAEI